MKFVWRLSSDMSLREDEINTSIIRNLYKINARTKDEAMHAKYFNGSALCVQVFAKIIAKERIANIFRVV